MTTAQEESDQAQTSRGNAQRVREKAATVAAPGRDSLHAAQVELEKLEAEANQADAEFDPLTIAAAREKVQILTRRQQPLEDALTTAEEELASATEAAERATAIAAAIEPLRAFGNLEQLRAAAFDAVRAYVHALSELDSAVEHAVLETAELGLIALQDYRTVGEMQTCLLAPYPNQQPRAIFLEGTRYDRQTAHTKKSSFLSSLGAV